MPAEVVAWTWHWGPPGSLASKAHFGDNLPFDVIRVGVVIAGAILVALCARVVVEQSRRKRKMARGQVARFIALGLAALAILITEAYVVGTTATLRLPVFAAVIGFGIWGTVGKRASQQEEPFSEG